MKKLITVIKREYVERVRSKWFIIGTILAPVLMIALGVLPGQVLTIKTGGPQRIAIVDLTPKGQLFDTVRDALVRERRDINGKSATESAALENLNASQQEQMKTMAKAMTVQFDVRSEPPAGRDEAAIKQALNAFIAQGQLDGYIILKPFVLHPMAGRVEYFGRNVNDVITRDRISHAITDAVHEQRFSGLGIDPKKVSETLRPVEMVAYPVNEKGTVGAKDSGEGFWVVFFLGLLIYMTIIMYGNSVLAAVIEEKGTRISEILFSSVSSFTLMMGKLIGVSLVGLTQYAIWGLMFLFFMLLGVGWLAGQGYDFTVPSLSGAVFPYLVIYFLIGYFFYASLYALVGSVVTTLQEGTQISMPITYTLIIGFIVSFSVIRNPDSTFAFWLSLVPFFSPIVMPLRIVSKTPPFWQIALSVLISLVSVIGVVWVTSRVYRVGMLMYGKRATIPEVARWIRQP